MAQGRKNPLYLSLAKRLKAARKAAGLGRKPLSVAAGQANNSVQFIETTDQVPGADTVERLAAVLSVSPSWLAFAEQHPMPSPIGERYSDIGSRLRAARTARGMSLRAVGAAAELTGATVHAIEQRPVVPRIDSIEKIAKALKISPGWLAFGEGESPVLEQSNTTQAVP